MRPAMELAMAREAQEQGSDLVAWEPFLFRAKDDETPPPPSYATLFQDKESPAAPTRRDQDPEEEEELPPRYSSLH